MVKNKTGRNVSASTYEQKAWNTGTYIVGIDEAGRGCLAGPVVAGAVALIAPANEPFLMDSKLLTPQKRAHAHTWIQKNAKYAVGMASSDYIDRTNILQATTHAMMLALKNLLHQLETPPSLILVDAVKLPHSFGIMREAHFRGEQLSISIAAASIVAKETRDALMKRQADYFPCFSFAQHKGYGTRAHYQEIAKHGATAIHRLSFAPLVSKESHDQQSSLFW